MRCFCVVQKQKGVAGAMIEALRGYAKYQRTPIRMTSWGKCAPLKLIAIVSLPHDAPLLTAEDHTPNGVKCKFATKPANELLQYITRLQEMS